MMHSILEKEDLDKLYAKHNLHFVEPLSVLGSHNDLMTKLPYCPVKYTPDFISYQNSYINRNDSKAQDLSLVLRNNKEPCSIWPLTFVTNKQKGNQLISSGGSILPPLFCKDISHKTVNRISYQCFEFLLELARLANVKTLHFEEPFLNKIGLTKWQQNLFKNKAKLNVKVGLFTNTQNSLQSIKSQFRKSYKSLITEAQRYWVGKVNESVTEEDWKEFQQLHIEVAGRVTRCELSWKSQFDSVNNGSSFFISLRDTEKKLIGGALFNTSRDEGLYAVAAYDRNLFNMPVGHLVQFMAIEEFKRRNIKWYYLGDRTLPNSDPIPTEKEQNISKFKQGFANQQITSIITSIST
jgi:FemAB family protein